MRKTYQITEYGSFISGKQVDGYSTLPEKTFEQLENFVLSNRNKETDALELLSLSAKKGLGKRNLLSPSTIFTIGCTRGVPFCVLVTTS